mgnify:CR=1 FL=1
MARLLQFLALALAALARLVVRGERQRGQEHLLVFTCCACLKITHVILKILKFPATFRISDPFRKAGREFVVRD